MTKTSSTTQTPQADQLQQAAPLFLLGQIVATSGLLAHLEANPVTTAQALVHRHVTGDFGDLCKDDLQTNVDAIASGDRVLSAYTVAGEKVYVISEGELAHRVTTILLAQEY